MKFIFKFYSWLGRVAYITLLPLIRIFVKRSHRAYVIVVCEGEILLIKNWLGRQYWGLPGGGIQKKEEPIQAVAREVKEETGLDIREPLELVAQDRWKADKLGYEYYIFITSLLSKATLHPRQYEIIAAEWVPLNRLKNYRISPDLRKIISDHFEL